MFKKKEESEKNINNTHVKCRLFEMFAMATTPEVPASFVYGYDHNDCVSETQLVPYVILKRPRKKFQLILIDENILKVVYVFTLMTCVNLFSCL